MWSIPTPYCWPPSRFVPLPLDFTEGLPRNWRTSRIVHIEQPFQRSPRNSWRIIFFLLHDSLIFALLPSQVVRLFDNSALSQSSEPVSRRIADPSGGRDVCKIAWDVAKGDRRRRRRRKRRRKKRGFLRTFETITRPPFALVSRPICSLRSNKAEFHLLFFHFPPFLLFFFNILSKENHSWGRRRREGGGRTSLRILQPTDYIPECTN